MSIIVDNNNFNKFNDIGCKQSSDSLTPNPSRRKSVHINDIVSIIDIENQKQ